MDRWSALVEVVRLLVKSGRPGLAFASVCIFLVPFTIVSAIILSLAVNKGITVTGVTTPKLTATPAAR